MIAPVRPALLALALCLAAGPASGQGVTARTVVLGQSAALSGPQQSVGEDIRNGALAYLRTLNDAGGVHGRRIELATLDDGADAKRALANTSRFVEELGVFVLFGYPENSVSRELLVLVQRSRVPLFAPVTGAQIARLPNRYVFTIRAGHADEVEGVIGHYAELGLKRFALVRRDDAGGAEILEAARAALKRHGGEAPAVVLMQGAVGKPDAARDALAAGADVVIVAAPAEPAAALIRELRRARTPAQLVALSLADALPLARALGRDGAGVALSQVVPPLERTSLPVVAEYRAAIEAETGRKAYSAASLESYLAAKVLAEAVRQAGPALTREALLLALEAMSRYDAGGRIFSFSRNNHQGSSRIELLVIGRDGRLLH